MSNNVYGVKVEDPEMANLGKLWIKSQFVVTCQALTGVIMCVSVYSMLFSKLREIIEASNPGRDFSVMYQAFTFYMISLGISAVIPCICIALAFQGVKSEDVSKSSRIAKGMCWCEGCMAIFFCVGLIGMLIQMVQLLMFAGLDEVDCMTGKGGEQNIPFIANLENMARGRSPMNETAVHETDQRSIEQCIQFVKDFNQLLPMLKTCSVVLVVVQICTAMACTFGMMQAYQTYNSIERAGKAFMVPLRRRGLKNKGARKQPGAAPQYAPVATLTSPQYQSGAMYPIPQQGTYSPMPANAYSANGTYSNGTY